MQFEEPEGVKSIEVDVEKLDLSHTFMEITLTIGHSLKIVSNYKRFEGLSNDIDIVTKEDYIQYMSNTEGIVLSQMNQCTMCGITKKQIDVIVKEYPYFKPLLQYQSKSDSTISQLSTYSKCEAYTIGNLGFRTKLEVIDYVTNIDNMLYPELVFDVNSTFGFGGGKRQITVLHTLLRFCDNDRDFQQVLAFDYRFEPSWSVDGTPNILYFVISQSYPTSPSYRTQLVKNIIDLHPELLTLGDDRGIINGDRKEFLLIHACLSNKVLSGQRNTMKDSSINWKL